MLPSDQRSHGVIGTVDAYREIDSRKWALADSRSLPFAAKHSAKTGLWFAGFFGAFQLVKYGVTVAR